MNASIAKLAFGRVLKQAREDGVFRKPLDRKRHVPHCARREGAEASARKGMARSTANMGQAADLQPFGEVARDVARSIVAEQSLFVRDLGAVSLKPQMPALAYRCRRHRVCIHACEP
jgi:hypothetical protein